MPAERGEPEDSAFSEILDVSMRADAEGIAEVVDTLSETLTRLHIPEQKRMEVQLAVQEALANAVVHGCENDPSKRVRCQMKSGPMGRIVIAVTDPGPGFSPDLVSDPKRHGTLYSDHGRGVYLIRQLMDEVHFTDRGNEIRMWKY
jgi:serine/threonine-protein kinase RsbW